MSVAGNVEKRRPRLTFNGMRVLVDILLVLGALLLPWWLALAVSVGFFFVFPRFYELLFIALLIDLLYGIPLERFKDFQFVLSLSTGVLFLLLTTFKKRMRI